MNPGRPLDRLIAEKIMEYPSHEKHHEDLLCFCKYHDAKRYSTEIAAAWELVEKLDLFSFTTLSKNERGWLITWNDESYMVYGDTASHAICLAAIKAIGIELLYTAEYE